MSKPSPYRLTASRRRRQLLLNEYTETSRLDVWIVNMEHPIPVSFGYFLLVAVLPLLVLEVLFRTMEMWNVFVMLIPLHLYQDFLMMDFNIIRHYCVRPRVYAEHSLALGKEYNILLLPNIGESKQGVVRIQLQLEEGSYK